HPLTIFNERKVQKSVELPCVAESATAVACSGHFILLADGFCNETHFTKRDAKVVVRFEVFIFRADLAEFGAKLVEYFLERTRLRGLRRRRIFLRGRRWLAGRRF